MYKTNTLLPSEKWADFIFNHPHGNIFQTPEMFEVYKKTRNYEPVFLAVVDEKGEILGTLLAFIQREFRWPLGYLSARSIILGGPLIKDNNLDVLNFILNEYNKRIKRRVIYSQFRNLWNWREGINSFEKYGFKFKDHLDILIDLKKPEAQLWNEIHSKRRNEIRKAVKECIIVRELKITSEHKELYSILSKVYQRARLPLPSNNYFFNALTILSKKDYYKAFGAFDNNKLIGVMLTLCYKNRIYDWYAGSFQAFYKKNPNDLIPWEVFKWGISSGYTIFDFGGAGNPNEKYGVRDYKLKFGGELVNYGRFVKIHHPILMFVAKQGFKLWRFLRR